MRRWFAIAQLAVEWWFIIAAFGFVLFVVLDTLPR